MMDELDTNFRDDAMDLDLNQAPLESSTGSVVGLGSILNELEIAHGQIEERIRQLEAVTARARQRQRWRQARDPPETSNVVIETVDNALTENRVLNMEQVAVSQEGTVDRIKSCSRDSSHLVAKALELDADVRKVVGDGGGFFDCNICLDVAREPILTCCGHLFCWVCFYQLPYVYSTAKECPVCKGEVTDGNIIPIYGSGMNTRDLELVSGLKVPPRPKAHRIESIRQHRVNRGISHIPVAEALRRIRMGIGAMGERGERHQREDLDGVRIRSDRTDMPSQGSASEVPPNPEVGGSSRRLRSRQFSRVLSESADSLLSISSALNNAERLVDDLESYIHNRVMGSHEQVSSGGLDSFISTGDLLSLENQTPDSTVGVSSAAPLASSSELNHDEHVRNVRREIAAGVNSIDPRPSSSSRRRIRLSRVSDVDNGVARETRRRRLN